jgi:hypothetical protein
MNTPKYSSMKVFFGLIVVPFAIFTEPIAAEKIVSQKSPSRKESSSLAENDRAAVIATYYRDSLIGSDTDCMYARQIKFRKIVETYLNNKESIGRPLILPSTNKIRPPSNLVSPDGKVRILSWYAPTGGSWVGYKSLFQVCFNDSSAAAVEPDFSAFANEQIFDDIDYGRIDTIRIGNALRYWCSGLCNHGAHSAYYLAFVLTLENRKLRLYPCFHRGQRILSYIKSATLQPTGFSGQRYTFFEENPQYNPDLEEQKYITRTLQLMPNGFFEIDPNKKVIKRPGK